MMTTRSDRAVFVATLLALAVPVAACTSADPGASPSPAADGGGEGGPASLDAAASTDAPVNPGGYTLKYASAGDGLRVGRGAFQLQIEHKGAPATGLGSSLSLRPVMTMPNMAHGAPVPIDAVRESATPGTYDCTLFFPMASVDASGSPVGEWSVKVASGAGELGSITVPVRPALGVDTTHVMLKNAADKVQTMGSAMPRSYPLFRDGLALEADGRWAFRVFVASIQEGNMVWPPVKPGLVLVDAAGKPQFTIQTVALEASSDGVTWSPMPCDSASRCEAKLTGLARGVVGKVHVKLTINGLPYTSDGMPPDDGKNNGFAIFAVTP